MTKHNSPKTTVYIGAQLDKQLYAQLQEYADERNLMLAEALRRAIRRLLGKQT